MSARLRFQQNKDLVTGYNDLIDSAKMTAAFDAAMVSMIEGFGLSNTHEEAAANAYRLEGAQKYLNYLRGLNSQGQITKQNQTNLQHNV